MPYTPPSQRSPAASIPDTPPASRDGSWVKPLPSSSPFVSGPRPGLPRSASSTSYLHRHRRSPSGTHIPLITSSISLDAASRNRDGVDDTHGQASNGSVRQPPPPPLSNLNILPGAVMSPPDSGSSSNSDEGLTMVERGRKLENLAELQAAISVLEQQRTVSPERQEIEANRTKAALGLDTTVVQLPTAQKPAFSARPPLSKEARKISHSRSATETNAYFDLPRSHSYSPPSGSSDDELEDPMYAKKPPMLRKKSGELVRPALRPPSARRRPSSMPGTPTFGKAVHFSNDLEHVRHFNHIDRPLAVSAETSPTNEYDNEPDYPFEDTESSSRDPSFEWEIRLANFPTDTPDRKSAPVRVERVCLSTDKKTLIGTVAVQNLAFQKLVIARFTFDYWKTTSEITAEFSHDIRRQKVDDGCDRFNFNIRLADQTNLEKKTLFFCVRYVVNGQEYWDSNNLMNYQVDFIKNQLPQAKPVANGSEATRHLNGLPRSRSPRQSPTAGKNFDDFSRGSDWNSGLLPRSKSAVDIIDDTAAPIRLRSKAAGSAFEDFPGRKHSKGAAQAFASRYDFASSLHKAISNASTALGDRSGFPPHQPNQSKVIPNSTTPASSSNATPAPAINAAKPAALTSEKPAAQSQSYNELLEKYCFVGFTKDNKSGPTPQAQLS